MRKFLALLVLLPFVTLSYACDEQLPTQPEPAAEVGGTDANAPLFDGGGPHKSYVGFWARGSFYFDDGSGGRKIFQDIIFQHGEGYDPATGNFTAPVRGVYSFSASMNAEGIPTDEGLTLRLHTPQGYLGGPTPNVEGMVSTTVSVTTVLEAGQQVFVTSFASGGDGTGHFSGHLAYSF